MRRVTSRLVILTLALTAMAGGCNTGGESPFGPTAEVSVSLEEFVASVFVGSTEGTMRSGFLPGETGGPIIDVVGNRTIVNGGTSELTITAARPFSTVFVAIAGISSGIAIDWAGISYGDNNLQGL